MGIRAAASIAIELRLRAGDSIEAAARHVANELTRRRDALREIGVPAVEKITWRTVKSWRDRCKGAEIGDDEGDRYRNFCSRALDDSIDLKSAADRILSASIEEFPKVMGRPPASAAAAMRDGSKVTSVS